MLGHCRSPRFSTTYLRVHVHLRSGITLRSAFLFLVRIMGILVLFLLVFITAYRGGRLLPLGWKGKGLRHRRHYSLINIGVGGVGREMTIQKKPGGPGDRVRAGAERKMGIWLRRDDGARPMDAAGGTLTQCFLCMGQKSEAFATCFK